MSVSNAIHIIPTIYENSPSKLTVNKHHWMLLSPVMRISYDFHNLWEFPSKLTINKHENGCNYYQSWEFSRSLPLSKQYKLWLPQLMGIPPPPPKLPLNKQCCVRNWDHPLPNCLTQSTPPDKAESRILSNKAQLVDKISVHLCNKNHQPNCNLRIPIWVPYWYIEYINYYGKFAI